MPRRLVALLAASLLSCAHAPASPAEAPKDTGPELGMTVNGDQVVRTFDLNGDGKPDDWKYYRLVPDPADPSVTLERLEHRELDTNFDGKPDVMTWFGADGARLKEAFDLDFDGRPDAIALYEGGVLVRKETWQRHGEKPDSVAYYEGGKKVRVERDAAGHGQIDTWEYYENGKLSRVGGDLDGDGLVDRWFKSKDDDAPEPPKKT